MIYLVHFLTFLEVLTALMLIGIILIQQSKAGGGLGAMGGGMTETVFGASAGNVLAKGTVWLAATFLCLTLLVATITGRANFGGSVGDELASEPAEKAQVSAPDDTEAPPEDATPATSDAEAVETTPKVDAPSTPAATPVAE